MPRYAPADRKKRRGELGEKIVTLWGSCLSSLAIDPVGIERSYQRLKALLEGLPAPRPRLAPYCPPSYFVRNSLLESDKCMTVNGLPLAVAEVKNATSRRVDIHRAHCKLAPAAPMLGPAGTEK